MDARYQHQLLEKDMLQLWAEHDVANPDRQNQKKIDISSKNSFSVVMPPPNANDPLHIGHALFVALEDIFVRFARMRGLDTVWLPGTDHAGIETQYVFEKKLAKEGKSRFDYDRDTLYQLIAQYVADNSATAVDQIKALGASADWSRFRYTLDPESVELVLATFEKMHQDGLIYRDLRLVNFSPSSGTSYSELEIVYEDRVTPLYYVRYYLVAQPKDYVVVATTRPEPIWADTHLAVHPANPKTQHLIGQRVHNPLTQAEMTIIADEFVDPEFGTGIVKLTPAHDHNDFVVAKKHQLPMVVAIDRRGKMTAAAGKYAGLSVNQARQQVVADLTASQHIEKIDEKYQHRIGTDYKTGKPIEPLPLPQFFVRVNDPKHSLTQPVLRAIEDKLVVIHGSGRREILVHWLNTLEDWNISRQIVWGIRIPVFYQVDGHEADIEVSSLLSSGEAVRGPLDQLLKQHSLDELRAGLQQLAASANVPYVVSRQEPTDHTHLWLPETDTFDTWFSSAQWPLITLKTGRPGDFERFYPTTLMETGYDILPFWVMRMLLVCTYLTGQVPFGQVYLHGLVRDQGGQKMSKSKGNVLNPLEIVASHGADALRFALVLRTTVGQDKSVGPADFLAARNFTNKIWNAARLVIGRAEPEPKPGSADPTVTAKLKQIVAEVTQQLADYKPGLAADTLYQGFWHWYCDEVLEDLKKDTVPFRQALEGLTTLLTLLHPFVPFVTEAVWQELLKLELVDQPILALQPWPPA